MKNRILILMILISSFSFGQSVPNTTTFSLQDVYNVVHSHASGTSTNLQSCFNNAVSSYFDATYFGSKNSLLNFRNYTVAALTIYNPVVASITSSSANLRYEFTTPAYSPNTTYGFAISTSANPTTVNSYYETTCSCIFGDVNRDATGLSAATVYHMRGYVIHNGVTMYSSDV